LNDNDIWEPNEESMVELKHNLPEILEVEYSTFPRKWSTGFSNMKDASLFSQQNEPPEDLKPTQDTFRNLEVEDIEYSPSQIDEEDNFEEEFPVVYQVGNMGTKYGEPAPFYVTLQINDFLLHNCVFDPDTPRNIMTERVMHQLGLSISQPNTQGGFTRGIIKDLSVSFHAFPDAPFTIDVLVIDTLSNWGILLRKDLIENLTGSFQDQGSKAIIPHPEGGFFTLHKEPITGCLIETPEEPDNQLLCVNNGIESWFIQGENSEDEFTQTPGGIWTLEFDGAHSSSGSGAGIVLTAPSKETFYYSYRLEYHCTNNVVEYEALIIGLNLAIDKGVTHLKVIGDSDLIVSQVLLDFTAKNERLKRYRDFARSIAKSFEIVSIKAVPREENYVADALVVSASTLQPCDGPLQNLCKMEVLFRPSIPDNLEHWQVFEDDDQILRFMENNREFTDSQVNFLVDSMDLDVVNLQNNTFPKGCVPLEHLFDRHDVYKGKNPKKQTDEALEFNIGTEMDPRMVKIGKGTTEKERIEILDLIREFKDTFSWNYDELKAYRGDVIQHAIPLTEGAKPFRQKLRHINPKLENQIQKELQKMVDVGIIAPIRYSSWMSNLVVVRKKSGDIRLCVDF
jgi:ribonuclease HI